LQYTKRQLFAMAQARHLPSGPLYDSSDLLSDPHFRERGFWPSVEHPGAGPVEQPGRPFVMSETPWRLQRRAPGLGEHTEDVLSGILGYSRRDLVRHRQLVVVSEAGRCRSRFRAFECWT
jgi:crotonobetainyl-CoA:carnitine CoA-transferase CaiB-like acyl-CoA transferase